MTPLDPFHIFYLGLLIVAASLAYFSYKKGEKKSFFLTTLLILTIGFESLQLMINFKALNLSFLADVYSPIEYLLFCMYYLKAQNVKSAKIWVKASIVVFFIFSLTIAFLVFRFGELYKNLITWNINIEGVLLLIVFTHLLFNLDDELALPIYKFPAFWVATGVMMFNGGMFVILVLYPILLKFGAAANFNYGIIMRPLNIILYLCIIGGSLCFLTNRKYLIQSR